MAHVEAPDWLKSMVVEMLELMEKEFPFQFTIKKTDVKPTLFDGPAWEVNIWPALGENVDGTLVYSPVAVRIDSVLDVLDHRGNHGIVATKDEVRFGWVDDESEELEFVWFTFYFTPENLPPLFRVVDPETQAWEFLDKSRGEGAYGAGKSVELCTFKLN